MFRQIRSLGKAIAPAFLLVLLSLSIVSCTVAGGSGGTTGSTPTPTATSGQASGATATPTHAPSAAFKVTAVQMSENPASIAGDSCGTSLTVTYSAVFHFPTNSAGGTVKFLYTVDNGRGTPSASFSVAAGQTSRVYTFTWSGKLEPDNVSPGLGGVIVTSPNQLNSQLVKPSGTCVVASSGAFKVTGASVAVSPTSLNGTHCGSQFTETYTATFHIAANSPGGTIVFQYSTNNGRGNSSSVSLHVAAGQTTATYTFYWKGVLPADHTEPGGGAVAVISPNTLVSSPGTPSGACS